MACTGDIRTLLDWDNYTTVNTENARFNYLFYNCSVLTSAPELPATSLAYNCYHCMFLGCTNLKSAELSIEFLYRGCCSHMFYDCTNLSSVTMLAPSDQITSKLGCATDWLNNAGTDPSVQNRTLKVQDKAAYEALKANAKFLPTNWQIGNCKVLDKDGNEITE